MLSKHLCKRIVSIILIVCMVGLGLPIHGFANINQTKFNSTDENNNILSQLQGIDGDISSARDITEYLTDLGIVDEDGLVETSMINMDGKDFTLEEVKAMLASDEIDLGKIISVDGVKLTLNNLKTMIEIEDEISRIKNEYFSNDIELTKEHEATFNSLVNQISTSGIAIQSDTQAVDLISPSDIDHQARVSYEISGLCYANYSSENTATVTFKLNRPNEQEVSFAYNIYSGSASLYEHFTVEDTQGSIVFEPGETEKTLDIGIKKLVNKPIEYGLPSEPYDFWTKDRVLYINCNSIKNALFENEKEKESMTITVAIENQFDLQECYDTAQETYLLDISKIISFEDTPGKYRNTEDQLIVASGATITSEIRTMIDTGVFSHMNLPVGYFSNENEADGNIEIGIIPNDKFESRPYTPITIPINSSDIRTDFNLNDIDISDIGFGSSLEGNGIIDSLDVIFDYSGISNDVDTYFWDDNDTFINNQMNFTDKNNPYVKSVEVPSDTYDLGENIPITITYSEPVYTDEIRIYVEGTELLPNGKRINVEGAELSPKESNGTISNNVSFLYKVETYGLDSLNVTNIKGAKDLSGKIQGEESEYTITVEIKEPIVEKAFVDASIHVNVEGGNNAKGEITVSLSDDDYLNDLVAAMLRKDDTDRLWLPNIMAKVIGKDDSAQNVNLYANEDMTITELKGEFDAPINLSSEDKHYIAEFYFDGKLLYPLSAEYVIKPIVFIDDDEDLEIVYTNWPLNNIASAGDGTQISLSYDVKNNATWQSDDDFEWSSSDESVASIDTIDTTGNIIFTGKEGQVTFTLKALNGRVAGKEFSINSKTLEVKTGQDSFLYVPECVKNIEITSGNNARVYYTTNLTLNNKLFAGEETVTNYCYRLYEAEYESSEPQKGKLIPEAILTASDENDIFSCTIDKNDLDNISLKGRYSYILEISAQDLKTGETLFTYAYIAVRELPAKVNLHKPQNYYITDDTDEFEVSFDIENLNTSDNPEFSVSVVKNEEDELVFHTDNLEDIDMKHIVPIEKVDNDRLLDIYTVSLKAKNELDDAFSFDSYVLYVYNSKALKIMINGSNEDSFTMSISDEISSMTSDEILALNRKMNITDTLSINNKEYKWSNIADKITWESRDDSIVSIKYNDGGFYKNIKDYPYGSFIPNTNLLLQGKSSGNTLIKAIHNLTGMEENLDITVDNLEDKLYLFNVFPRITATVYYTNGIGEEKEATTNDKGSIAIYEESGIKSDVCFGSKYNDLFYSGNIDKKDLLSNQNNIYDFGLYPQNNVKMEPFVSKREIYLVKPDGQPYDGDVIIRGGVYRNNISEHSNKGLYNIDRYCYNAKINGFCGREDQIVKVNNGLLELHFNPDEFTTHDDHHVVTPKDRIEFIIEIRFKDNEYCPDLIKLNTYSGKYIKTLQSIDSKGMNNNIGILSQTVTIDGREEPMPEVLGVDPSITNTIINTEVMFPAGNFFNGYYEIRYVDKYGTIPSNQEFNYIDCPFLSMIIAKHTFKPNKYLYSTDTGEKIDLDMEISKDNVKHTLPGALKIRNMFGVENIENSSELSGAIDEISSKLKMTSAISVKNFVEENKIVGKALNQLSKKSIGNSFGSIIIAPTEDPLIYKGILKIAVGGVSLSDDKTSQQLEIEPSVNDIKDMQKGQYLKNAKEEMNEAKSYSKGTDVTFSGRGYMECEFFYNWERLSWDYVILKTDLFVGVGGTYTINYNTQVGPVPVTAQFKTGLSGKIGLKAMRNKYDDEFIREYITELRINLYVEAFGGVGFDYSVAALKIGVYGKTSVDGQFLFLNSSLREKNGQKITLSGETGIKFTTTVLFVTYEKVLATLGLEKSFKYNDFDEIENLYKLPTDESMKTFSFGGMLFEPVSESAAYEDRSYLSTFDRKWSTPMFSSVIDDEINIIQTNAYPYTNPVWTEDGMIMAYISDMNSTNIDDTAVCFTKYNEGTYTLGEEIDSSDYADTDVKIDGTDDFAAVTWIRCMNTLDKNHGDELTGEDILAMTTGTEIMTSIYNGTDFITTRRTNNSMPDMAPVVATNGEKVLVAWRNVYASDMDNPLDFDGRDKIMYSIYDDGEWSDEKCLYDGSTDKVKGISAKMLSDGTSAISYQIQINDTNNTEIACTVLDETGEVVNNIRITNNEIKDENPQITSVLFPDGVERFIIGWNTVNIQNDMEEDIIRLCAINDNAILYPEFEKQIYHNADVNNYQSFHFTKGAGSLDDLSIIWTEPWSENRESEEGSYRIDKDIIYGMKFIENDGNIVQSPKIKLVELDDYNVVDFFDSFTNNDTEEINLVLLTSDYSSDEVESIETTDGDTILLPVSKSNLSIAKASYKNSLIVEGAYFSYDDLIPEMDMPIQFCLFNEGIEPITKVTINLAGDEHVFEEDTLIEPGEYMNFTAFYKVPERIINPDYSVTAEFLTSNDTKSDKLYMDIPDVGIYRIDITKEMERERSFNVHLYNDTFSKLTPGKHVVKLELFDNPNLDGKPIESIAISDAESLDRINDGIFTQNVSLDEEALRTILDENGEIPQEGFRLYFSTVIEENGYPILEMNIGNNTTYVKIHSLLTKNSEDTTIASVMENETGKSVVKVEVLNNSMNEINNGNITVNLKDEKGNIIETKQTYNSQDVGKGLITLRGEEKLTETFDFSKLGVSSEVIFSRVNDDSSLPYEEKPSKPDDREYKPQNDYKIKKDKKVVNGRIELLYNISAVKTKDLHISISEEQQKITVIIDKESTHNMLSKKGMIIVESKDYILKVPVSNLGLGDNESLTLELSNLDDEANNNVLKTLASQNFKVYAEPVMIKLYGISNQTQRYIDGFCDYIQLSFLLEDKWLSDVITLLRYQNNSINHIPTGVYGKQSNSLMLQSGVYVLVSGDKTFEDITNHWAKDYIENMASRALLYGKNSTDFCPDDIMTRAEMATLVHRLLALLEKQSDFSFYDVLEGAWYENYVSSVASYGLMVGYTDGNFGVNNQITRQETMVLIDKVMTFVGLETELSDEEIEDIISKYDDSEYIPDWAKKSVATCVKTGIVKGYDNKISPTSTTTRAEIAKMFYILLDLITK